MADMNKIFELDDYRDYYTVDVIDSFIDLAFKISRDVHRTGKRGCGSDRHAIH
jgi:hypothetical protein